MSQLQLIDATRQIEQAQAVLSMWLESTTKDTSPDLPRLIGSILTLLHGVRAMGEAESKLADYVMREYRGQVMSYHAEATPHGVNIMTRNDAGMYEHVALSPMRAL
jgi:hypothetical protein